MSSDRKTPIIALSSASMKKQNSFTFLWIDCHEPSSASGVRKPVSTTRNRLMPSTPRAYWMPNDGIQSTFSTIWKSAPVGSNFAHIHSVAANSTSDRPRAVHWRSGSRS